MRYLAACIATLALGACSGGSDEPTNQITRIDGPAVVDDDRGGADNRVTDDSDDG